MTRDGVTIFVASQYTEGPARVGISVGKRCGGAVTRNRIKRRLRAASAAAGLPDGFNVVVQARPGAARASFQELVEAVSEAVAARGDA